MEENAAPKSHPAVDGRAILVGDRDWSDVDAHFESGILPSIGELRSWLGSYRKTLEIPSIFPESVTLKTWHMAKYAPFWKEIIYS